MDRRFFILIGMLLISATTLAGSGFYLGGDIIGHSLKTSTTTIVIASPFSSDTTFAGATDNSIDIGFRTGYKFKSRLTDRYFWAPEFSFVTLENSYLYSTNLKFGYEFAPYEFYTTLGVSRIEKFTDNRLNFALGVEYRLNNQSSINFELTGFDNIKENSKSGSAIFINTNTTRKINSFKIGYTYYFQGSI